MLFYGVTKVGIKYEFLISSKKFVEYLSCLVFLCYLSGKITDVMRKLFALLAVVMLLASCVSSKLSQEEKACKQAERKQQVMAALQKRHYIVNIDYVYPKRMSAQPVVYGYSLKICGDSVISCLPYFGRAYNIPYGGGKGLNFTAPISNYQSCRVKKDVTRVYMEIENEEDTYSYQLDIYDNGSVMLDVLPRERESISFSGNMVLDNDK